MVLPLIPLAAGLAVVIPLIVSETPPPFVDDPNETTGPPLPPVPPSPSVSKARLLASAAAVGVSVAIAYRLLGRR
jgi:hypothetical protein